MGEVVSETIVAAAIKVGALICSVERPGRHHDVFNAMLRAGFVNRIGPEQQGFITSHGRFVGRELGRQIAEGADQIIAGRIGPDGVPYKAQHPQLFSEDVW